MKLLLISRSVPDFQVFVDAANEDTRAVLYSSSMTQSELLESIQLTSAERIAVVSRKEDSFVEDKSIPESVELFKSLIQTLGVNTLDFLACNTLLDPLWTQFFNSLEVTGVTVGASNDLTGNLKYGGDWTMESTGQDIETVYFNKSIEYYKYLLDVGAHSLFIKSDGTLWGAGRNNYRQLGIDGTSFSTEDVNVFSNIPFSKKAVQFSCGLNHTVVLLEDGTVWGAGRNNYRQLGINGTNNTLLGTVDSFTKIPLSKKALQVSCGNEYTIVLLEDGTLWGSGRNTSRQMGINGTDNTFLGKLDIFTNIPLSEKAINVACGELHTVVLLEDGTVWGSGMNFYRQFGIKGTDNTENGNLSVFTNIPLTEKAVQVSCGFNHSVILLKDGSICGAGYNGGRELGINGCDSNGIDTTFTGNVKVFKTIPLTKKAFHVCCGQYHTVVLLEDGTIFGTGLTANGQLGQIVTNTSVTGFATVNVFTHIPLTKKAVQVYCGGHYTMVLLEDSTLWFAGRNYNRQLGMNGTDNSSTGDVSIFTKLPINEKVMLINSPTINADSSSISKLYFSVNSFVVTDQGYIYVSNLDPIVHTIMGHRILSITDVYKDKSLEKVLVFIKKDSYNDFPRLLS
jgi:alpha-tubulin suppressor-like RCC1 family protein